MNGRKRIVLVGGSAAFGTGLNSDSETFAHQLEKELESVEVINAAVIGHKSGQPFPLSVPTRNVRESCERWVGPGPWRVRPGAPSLSAARFSDWVAHPFRREGRGNDRLLEDPPPAPMATGDWVGP